MVISSQVMRDMAGGPAPSSRTTSGTRANLAPNKAFNALETALISSPECRNTFEIPFWAAAMGGTASVWVDAPMNKNPYSSPKQSDVSSLSGKGEEDEREYKSFAHHALRKAELDSGLSEDKCFALLASVLELKDLPLSLHKATDASKDMIW